jgi:hypothetical protein
MDRVSGFLNLSIRNGKRLPLINHKPPFNVRNKSVKGYSNSHPKKSLFTLISPIAPYSLLFSVLDYLLYRNSRLNSSLVLKIVRFKVLEI